MNKILFGIILLSLLPVFGQAQAALFKWTDEKGVVHFSDQPFDESRAERIEMPRASAPGAPPPASNGDDATAAAREEGDALARHQSEVRAANCEIARRTFEHNRNIVRMYRLDENGERVFLSDEEREEALQRSSDNVAHWCDD